MASAAVLDFDTEAVRGFNPRRADGTSERWMGLSEAKYIATGEEKTILNEWKKRCAASPANGPTSRVLYNMSEKAPGHELAAYQQLRDKMIRRMVTSQQRMRPMSARMTVCTYANDPSVQEYYVDGRAALTAEEALHANIYYPNQPRVFMACAMKPGTEFSNRKGTNIRGTNERPGLLNVLKEDLIAELVLRELDFTSRTALSESCLDGLGVVGRFQSLYNLSDWDLEDSEFTDAELANLKAAGEKNTDKELHGAKYLMVSEVHPRWYPQTQSRPTPSYSDEARGLGRFLRSMSLRGNITRNLTLCGVKFLDHKVTAGVVRLLPNLERLEIVKCEMFRYHQTAPFVSFIKDVQAERGCNIYLDIAPLYETGTRWKDWTGGKWDEKTSYHKGTFGLTHSDSGTKIGTAVVTYLFFHLLPALEAAGQMHMIENYSSLLRQYHEALPIPEKAVPKVQAAYETFKLRNKMVAEAEAEWVARHERNGQEAPEYTRSKWPDHLRMAVKRKDMVVKFLLASAMFGEHMFAETFDMSARSSNFQCRLDNFEFWSDLHRCTQCDKQTWRFMFTAFEICESCRLEDWTYEESDHMKRAKLLATKALGFGDVRDEEYRDLSQSNFPKADAFFETDADGNVTPRIHGRFDIISKVLNAADSPLAEFFSRADAMVTWESNYYHMGHIGLEQKDHPDSGYQSTSATVMDSMAVKLYRKSSTCQEFLDNDCFVTGWTPAIGHKVLKTRQQEDAHSRTLVADWPASTADWAKGY